MLPLFYHIVHSFEEKKRKKEKKVMPVQYRHECESVTQMSNTTSRVVSRGVMPLVGDGLCKLKISSLISNFREVQWCFVCCQVSFY